MGKPDLLKEFVVRDVVEYLVTDNAIEVREAMSQFYNSEVFSKLGDVETGLYLCSSSYVYELFRDEMQSGALIQKEI